VSPDFGQARIGLQDAVQGQRGHLAVHGEDGGIYALVERVVEVLRGKVGSDAVDEAVVEDQRT
jgi:hypothetical protein